MFFSNINEFIFKLNLSFLIEKIITEKIVPQILMVLCSGNLTPKEHLETQQALVKQLAEILDFVLKFDDLKMNNPSIQNDFSYYRRTINRRRVDDNFDLFSKEGRLLPNELGN